MSARLGATVSALWLLAAVPAPAQVIAGAPVVPPEHEAPASTTAGTGAPAVELRFTQRPSLRVGDVFRLDVTARFQGDVRRTDGVNGDDVDFDVARRRIGVRGTLTSHLEFEVERELGSSGSWRDVFVNWRTIRAVQVRAGQFKMPFSLEQMTSASNLDFVVRSRAADLVAPGRSIGVSAHGRLAHHVVGYEAGAFTRDGEVARFGLNPGTGPTVAGRITVRPRGAARRSGSLGDIEVGAAATRGELTEGPYSLRGRLMTKQTFFSPVFVDGRRLRVGGDLDWRPGPFGVRAEFLRADDARQNQGLMGETLPAVRSEGWYVSGVWAVAGRRQHAKANDAVGFAGVKGLELAARLERLWFGTPGESAPQVRTPRAEYLSRVSDEAWTLGVNWTLNRFARIQVNAVREHVTDGALGAAPARAAAWTPVLRVQVGM